MSKEVETMTGTPYLSFSSLFMQPQLLECWNFQMNPPVFFCFSLLWVFFFSVVFETGSYSIAQAGLELLCSTGWPQIWGDPHSLAPLTLQRPKYWDYRHEPSQPTLCCFLHGVFNSRLSSSHLLICSVWGSFYCSLITVSCSCFRDVIFYTDTVLFIVGSFVSLCGWWDCFYSCYTHFCVRDGAQSFAQAKRLFYRRVTLFIPCINL